MQVGEDRPHGDVGVKMLALHLEPLLTPDPETADDLGQLAAGVGQVVGRAPARGIGPGFDHPLLLEAAQALAEHAWRDGVQPLQDLTEVVMVGHDLAHDQRSPAFGEHL